jgi:hypothetical protein
MLKSYKLRDRSLITGEGWGAGGKRGGGSDIFVHEKGGPKPTDKK